MERMSEPRQSTRSSASAASSTEGKGAESTKIRSEPRSSARLMLAPTAAMLPAWIKPRRDTRILFLASIVHGGRGLEFFADPVGERVGGLASPQKLLHDFFARLGAAGVEDGSTVLHGCGVVEKVGLRELCEEVERDDLVIHIGVVVRGVSDQVREGGIHAVALNPLIRKEARIKLLKQIIEIERSRIVGVGAERAGGVVELGADSVGASKGGSAVHFQDKVSGNGLVRFVVMGEGSQQPRIAEEFFERL